MLLSILSQLVSRKMAYFGFRNSKHTTVGPLELTTAVINYILCSLKSGGAGRFLEILSVDNGKAARKWNGELEWSLCFI